MWIVSVSPCSCLLFCVLVLLCFLRVCDLCYVLCAIEAKEVTRGIRTTRSHLQYFK